MPYVRCVANAFKDHPAYKGVYFDDTFPSVQHYGISYLGYTSADRKRFCQWLRKRYRGIENLNMSYKIRGRKRYGSFDAVRPPKSPQDGLALWHDWTEARAEWCEDFARVAKDAFRSADPDPSHIIVLSDQEYHMRCTALQYGLDYARLLVHFDRFEIYLAQEHERVSRGMLLANVEHAVDKGIRLAGRERFQFHTWFTDPVTYAPMKPATLEAMLECAAAKKIRAIEIYAFKIGDWRKGVKRRLKDGCPALSEISLKYNPLIRRCLQRVIAGTRR